MPATKEKKIKSKVKEEFSSSTYIYWLKSMLLMRRFEEMACFFIIKRELF